MVWYSVRYVPYGSYGVYMMAIMAIGTSIFRYKGRHRPCTYILCTTYKQIGVHYICINTVETFEKRETKYSYVRTYIELRTYVHIVHDELKTALYGRQQYIYLYTHLESCSTYVLTHTLLYGRVPYHTICTCFSPFLVCHRKLTHH
jgi:hypothetical protein